MTSSGEYRLNAEYCLDMAPLQSYSYVGKPQILLCDRPKDHKGNHSANFTLQDERQATLLWDR
jgi:hypothetical protein